MPSPRRGLAPLAALLALSAPLALAACATPAPVAAPPAAPSPLVGPVPRQPQALVLRHATVLPASGPAIPDGAVVLERGRITAVGPSATVATPPGARELDLTGRFVTPGLVDSHTHLGVYGQPESFAHSDGNEMTSPITAEASAEHAYWPQDAALGRALAGGVTSALVLPGSANLVGGRGLPVKLRPGRSAAEARFPGAPDSLKMACGENPRRIYGEGKKQAPQTRMGNVSLFRQAFLDAQDYQARQQEWRTKQAEAGAAAGPAPRRDLKLETLAAALRGEVLVQIHCYRADELAAMLAVADELGFRIRAFHHALEAYKVRDLLAARGVATATHADWWGYKLEAWDGIPENAGLATRAGGRATIQSDSPVVGQRLGQEAAKAMWAARAAGVPVSDEEALRWVTLDAAWVLGVDGQTGSLEPGKMADVVVWSGHPFSVYARAEQVYLDGLLAYDVRAGLSPSDFELREPRQAPAAAPPLPGRPAGAPAPAAPCDGGAVPCPAPLPVTADRCLAITGARVVGGAGPPGEATVVVEGERITRVAPGLAAPTGCREVDGRGLVLSPGLLDPVSTLGLEEVSGEEGARDLGPGGEGAAAPDPVRAALRAADSVNPASALLPVARQGGLTGAVAFPGGGLVSGQAAFVGTDGQVRVASVGLAASLGVAGAQALHSTRGAALQRLRELLDDARTYAARRSDFDGARLRRVSASRLDLEALQPVLAGQLPLVVEADRVSDLLAALALAREWKLRLVVRGGAEAWLVARELAEARVPVLLDPQEDLPASFDQLGARSDNAALLAAAGVPVLIAPRGMAGEPHQARTLRQVAGLAVAHGLPWALALRGVTAGVAEAYGLPGGRVAEGVVADLVLWSGDPLELSSRPLAMWIGGRQAPLASRQQALLERYRVLGPEATGAVEPARRP
ncbi:MAG: amidohydrolase family protein [Anaeromyxobacter sp.]|nr:amidohydrolase family protein [Anaeromyxobacter sp.]